MANWAQFDGDLARCGAPSLLSMNARRGLNLAYSRVVENLNKDERAEFESEISLGLLELQVRKAIEEQREKERRQQMAKSLGEVG